jgi:hypothetical protein
MRPRPGMTTGTIPVSNGVASGLTDVEGLATVPT